VQFYETLLGGLLPKNSLFVLTLLNGNRVTVLDTTVSWSAVPMPEEPLRADLLVELAVLALAVGFRPEILFPRSAAM